MQRIWFSLLICFLFSCGQDATVDPMHDQGVDHEDTGVDLPVVLDMGVNDQGALPDADPPDLPVDPPVASCEPIPIPENAIEVGPQDNWVQAINSASFGQTVVLAPGTYVVPAAGLWVGANGVTIRGGGPREAVMLDGNYAQTSGGIINISGRSDVTIAHLSIRRSRYHAIHGTGGGSGPSNNLRLHDLHIQDPGEQAIKINANSGNEVDFGELSCSLVELTDGGRSQVMSYESSGMRCYTGGIDTHRSRGWVVRDNLIQGFWCSNEYLSQHGIHFWRGARDTVVERNVLIDNARGIGFGLGQPGSGRTYADDPCNGAAEHYGGVIRNNVVIGIRAELFDSPSGMDTGISLESACDAIVVHNTVASSQAPFSSIEWRFSKTSAEFINNLATHTMRPRNEAQATLVSNLEDSSLAHFIDFQNANLRLQPDATALIGQGHASGLTHAPQDHDGVTRNNPPDIGAFQK